MRKDDIVFLLIPGGSVHDEKICVFCFREAKRAEEIADMLHLTNSTYFRRKILGNLVAAGYLLTNKMMLGSKPLSKKQLLSCTLKT